MRKRFAILFGLFCLAMLDSIFSFCTPPDYTYARMSVIWHFYFIGILVFVRDKPWYNRILIAAAGGLVFDLFFTGTFPFAFFVYPLLAVLVGLNQKRMESVEFAFFVYLLCCFGIDFLPWLWQSLHGITDVSLISWLYHMQLITLLVDSLTILAVMYADMVMDRFYLMEKRRRQKKSLKRSAARQAAREVSSHPALAGSKQK